jgi:NAD+ synthase (glutamine-hydrolysing)
VEAKRLGATFRLGPELEVCGYGCEDHFFELDTVRHSWQTIAEILRDKDLTRDILCDIGMPLHFKNTLYNCRVLILNQKIVLIRPKMFLASGNNYRESRWFTPWTKTDLEKY